MNRLFWMVVATGLTTVAAAGCGGSGSGSGSTSEDTSAGAEALPPAPTVSGAEARQMVADGALLLDVTPAPRNAESHIEGATNIPLPELADRMNEVPRDRPIVVYCFGGRGSPQAGAMLQAEGYDVHVMGARSHWEEAAPVDESATEEGE